MCDKIYRNLDTIFGILNGSISKLKSTDVTARTRLKILKRNIFDIRMHAIYFPVLVTATCICAFPRAITR